jgi:hypothetical protein
MTKNANWLEKIPASVENGRLKLKPENDEPMKSVADVASRLEKAVEYEIANSFPGVL